MGYEYGFRKKGSVLSLKVLNHALDWVTSEGHVAWTDASNEEAIPSLPAITSLATFMNTNFYGASFYTLNDIYDLIETQSAGYITDLAQQLGQAINGTNTGTLADLTGTYTNFANLVSRIETIDSLLDLTTVADSDKTLYDTIKELSDWITGHETEVLNANTTYLDTGKILVGTACFTDSTAVSGNVNTKDYNQSVVTLAATLPNANYKVFIEPRIVSSLADPEAPMDATEIGEYFVSNKTTTSFTISDTGNSTFSYNWVLIPDDRTSSSKSGIPYVAPSNNGGGD